MDENLTTPTPEEQEPVCATQEDCTSQSGEPQEGAKKQNKIKQLITYIKTHEEIRQMVLFLLFSFICGASQMIITLVFSNVLPLISKTMAEPFSGWFVFQNYENYAGFVGFLCGSVVGQVLTFVLNRKKTFKATNNVVIAGIMYTIMACLIIIMQTALGGAVSGPCRASVEASGYEKGHIMYWLADLPGLLVGGIAALIVSFLGNKFLVMRDWGKKKAEKEDKKNIIFIVVIVLLAAALIASVAVNIYLALSKKDVHFQDNQQLYTMTVGILDNNFEFGEEDAHAHTFTYDFEAEDYSLLKSNYGIEKIAGSGGQFERAMRLMDEFAPRLAHLGNYDNSKTQALELLQYSLDNKKHGINCRAKAQILNEMCLALGIYSRKVWLQPYSQIDQDCHVVNEVWDDALNKWIMLDITNNKYWVDENGTPLSVLEIRQKGAKQQFCTPISPDDKLQDLPRLQEKYFDNFLYIMKNMVYMSYLDGYGVGESMPVWTLLPKNCDFYDDDYIISVSSIYTPPTATP